MTYDKLNTELPELLEGDDVESIMGPEIDLINICSNG
jgi:hypothetical protein